jgi:hypothetical protein
MEGWNKRKMPLKGEEVCCSRPTLKEPQGQGHELAPAKAQKRGIKKQKEEKTQRRA